MVPKVLYFDSAQGLIAMEYLENYKILRNKLIEGEKVDGRHTKSLRVLISLLHLLPLIQLFHQKKVLDLYLLIPY